MKISISLLIMIILNIPTNNDPKSILSQTKPNVDQFNYTDKTILKNIHD